MTQGTEVPARTSAPALESFTPEQQGIIKQLFDAAIFGNLGGIEECITAWEGTGADVKHLLTAKDTYYNWPPLHAAAAYGPVAVITALIAAARDAGGDDTFIQGMLTAKDTDGWTPLHAAAARGKVEVITTLIVAARDASGDDKFIQGMLTAKDIFGGAPLLFAAVNGKVDAALALLDLGLEVGGFEFVQNKMLKAQNNNGRTATDRARRRGDTTTAEAIENWLAEKQQAAEITDEITEKVKKLDLPEKGRDALTAVFNGAMRGEVVPTETAQNAVAALKNALSGSQGASPTGLDA